MQNILVTGASGLVGRSILTKYQQLSNYNVITLGGSPLSNANHIPMDFRGGIDCRQLPAHVDAIIHLAQSENYRRFPDMSLEVFQVNVVACMQLLEYARAAGAKTFVMASSGGVFQNSETQLCETDLLSDANQTGFYQSTKISCEYLSSAYASFYNIVRLRPFFIYGPHQKRHMLMARLITNIAAGEPITLQGEDGIAINPIFSDDAAECFIQAVDMDRSDILNVAGAEILTMRQIAMKIGNVLGKQPVFCQIDELPKNLIASTEKMRNTFHFTDTPFDEGIRRMIKAMGY